MDEGSPANCYAKLMINYATLNAKLSVFPMLML